ncbi:MAG: nitroreductase [Clostridiales bacterium]|nr:nitroreductase [Clostridiales bacterium]
MDVKAAVESRRSIRRFKPEALPRETIESILDAARLSPSGKNNQPWQFVVVQGDEREAMSARLQAGLKATQGKGIPTGSAENTFRIMREAPATVFVFNTKAAAPWEEQSVMERIFSVVNVQSIGGAIQSMLLRAQEMGVGSLWICDTFSAYEELCAWLGKDSLLVAAVSLGYADETPDARPRLPLSELVEWRG